MPDERLPSGTVTFLFTDVEDSTGLTRRLGEDWPDAHASQRRLLREAAAGSGGREVDTQGDSFLFVFARAREAAEAAASAQRALAAHPWPREADVRVRMGLHTGEPTVGEEGYLGLDVVRAARVAAAAHGGEILLSETTRALLGGDDPSGTRVEDLGVHRLRGLERDERLFRLRVDGLPGDFGPPRTEAPTTPAAGMDPSALSGRIETAVHGLTASIERSVVESLAAGLAAEEPPRRRTWEAALWPAVLALVVVAVPIVWLLTR